MTSDQAGDGTTTATVLAHAIVKEGAKSKRLPELGAERPQRDVRRPVAVGGNADAGRWGRKRRS